MTLKLYYHPISGYSQKVLIALHEKNVEFTPAIVDLFDPAAKAAYREVSPFGKVPTLKIEDEDWVVPESSIIIEYLENRFATGTKLIPDDKNLARRTRFYDRLMDLYVHDPLGKIFFDGFRPAGKNDPFGVERAKETLDIAYARLDAALAKRRWLLDDEHFTMADCAAAPPLANLRVVHPYAEHKHLTAYFQRLVERPSVARVLKDAEPYLAKIMKK
jgi:glutathione S-transferase